MNLLEFRVKSAYRNLEGLKIKFDKDLATYVLIGANGAGKSNVLEALSSVFYTLYYDSNRQFEFGFYLKYKISGHDILMIYNFACGKFVMKLDNTQVSDEDIDTMLKQYLPSRIVCNYSGEDSRIFEAYYEKPRKNYVSDLIKGNASAPLQMMFVNKDYWKIIFVAMCCCRHDVQAFDDFLNATLCVKQIDSITMNIKQEELGKWNNSAPALYLRQFLARTEGKNITIDDFNPNGDTPGIIYNNLVGVYELIKDDFSIKFNGDVDTAMLSEGEKKMMVVLFMLEALSDERSLLLLDEPDSHIHIAQKGELVSFLNSTDNRENVITTHSPSLTTQFSENAIIMLSANEQGNAEVVDRDKAEIVRDLTNDMWTVQEQNMFLNSNDDILLVEGWTDETYISKALEIFNKRGEYADLKFSYLPCNGSQNVKLMSDRFHPKKGQLLIALFDDDAAGWSAVRDALNLGNAERKTFGKAQKRGDIWYVLIPAKSKKLKGDFNIEDYFDRHVFLSLVMRFKKLNDIKDKSSFKQLLAKECKNNMIKPEKFVRFSLLFDLLREIKKAEKDGKIKL